jgi:hypothetical protein
MGHEGLMSDELVPQPKDAVTGDQRRPSPAEDTVGQAAKILSMDQTLHGIASTNPRSLGSGVGPHLLVAAFGEQSNNVRELKDELREVRVKLEEQTKELTKCKIENGELKERVANMDSARKIRNIAAAGATVMLSVGLKLVGTQTAIAWVLMVFGIGLLIGSWFVGGPKSK